MSEAVVWSSIGAGVLLLVVIVVLVGIKRKRGKGTKYQINKEVRFVTWKAKTTNNTLPFNGPNRL